MTQNATQAKKSRSFTVGVSFRLSSYYSLTLPSFFIIINRIKLNIAIRLYGLNVEINKRTLMLVLR